MHLTRQETDILNGSQGPVLQKIMQTLVQYGRALGAERLVDVQGAGHFSISAPTPGTALPFDMLAELVEAGLKTRHPFTLDPRAPLDCHNLMVTPDQARRFKEMFADEARYHRGMLALGLKDDHSYTCAPYLPQVGNVPERGTILAWSESSCVVYANSVLGARTNRNGAIIDLLSNIAGKTPLTGLLTDAGRRAVWRVDVCTARQPDPQLLGGAIGRKVQEDVPYITGLGRFLAAGPDADCRDYLKEMGAACAALGAVGLYHAEGITPEAVEQGRTLLLPEHRTYTITDQELESLRSSYTVLWTDKDVDPQKCLIGCPHLSLEQLRRWSRNILQALQAAGRDRLAVPTLMAAPLQVLDCFKADRSTWERLQQAGAGLTATCFEDYLNNELCSREAVITNSNKLRAFTSARLFGEPELLEIMVRGKI